MRIVDQQITPQRARREVVDTACAVRDIAHDEGGNARAELGEDVRDGRGEQQQTLGELQRNRFCARGANAVDAFVDLEAVVGRQQCDGLVDVLVVQNVVGDCVQRAGSATRLCDCMLLVYCVYA
jgi:hypothetical protein